MRYALYIIHSTNILRNRAEYRLILGQGISARLSRTIVLLFNSLITKYSFIAERLETIFISTHHTSFIYILIYILKESSHTVGIEFPSNYPTYITFIIFFATFICLFIHLHMLHIIHGPIRPALSWLDSSFDIVLYRHRRGHSRFECPSSF